MIRYFFKRLGKESCEITKSTALKLSNLPPFGSLFNSSFSQFDRVNSEIYSSFALETESSTEADFFKIQTVISYLYLSVFNNDYVDQAVKSNFDNFTYLSRNCTLLNNVVKFQLLFLETITRYLQTSNKALNCLPIDFIATPFRSTISCVMSPENVFTLDPVLFNDVLSYLLELLNTAQIDNSYLKFSLVTYICKCVTYTKNKNLLNSILENGTSQKTLFSILISFYLEGRNYTLVDSLNLNTSLISCVLRLIEFDFVCIKDNPDFNRFIEATFEFLFKLMQDLINNLRILTKPNQVT